MEKDQGPPSNISAPPYPGPPLDNSGAVSLPQPGIQTAPQPVVFQQGTPLNTQHDNMEKPPPVVISATPHPGPPLDNSGAVYLPQPGFQTAPQPVVFQQGTPLNTQHAPQPVVFQYGTPQPINTQPVGLSPTVTQMVVVQRQQPTDVSGQMICQHCHASVVTQTSYKNGMLTWLICGTLGFLLFWPCCIIPFFVDSCRDVEHRCPNCNNVIHIYKRM